MSEDSKKYEEKYPDGDAPKTLVMSYWRPDPDKYYGVRDSLYTKCNYNDLVKPLDDTDPSTGGVSVSLAMLPDPISGKRIQLPNGDTTTTALGWAISGEADNGLVRNAASDYGWYQSATQIWRVTDTGFYLPQMTQNSVLFAGASGLVSQDNTNFSFTDSTDTLKVGGGVRVGTATDTATAGDLVAGLTGASRMFFDQDLQTLSVYDSAGTEDISLDAAGNSWYNGTGNFGFGTVSPDRKVEILSTSTQFRITHTDSTYYCDIAVLSLGQTTIENSAGNIFITPWGGVLEMTTSSDVSGNPVILDLTNDDPAGGHMQIELHVLDTVGDPKIIYQTESTDRWVHGVDHSDSNSWKISSGSALGTNDRYTLTATSGYTTFTPGVLTTGTAHAFQVTGAINTGGTNGLFKVLAAASTGQTLSTELRFIDLDLSATTTWATGALTSERAVYISAPTIAFAGSSTLTNAATVYIDRPPQAGTNATITNPYALWIGAGRHIRADGTNTIASAASAVWNAVLFDMDVSVSGSTNITTATGFNMVTLNQPTITDAGTMGTITNSATLYIGGAPTGSGLTITNAYALWVDAGDVRFDAALSVATFTVSGLTSGRVTFATTGGQLTDDAGFTFDGVTLTLSDSNAATTPLHIFNQASTGDSAIRWSLATTISYAMGIDNSVAGDPFVLSTAASGTAVLGTGNILSITSAGTATLPAIVATSSITDNGLTAGRVVIASTSGLLADDSDLTFSGSTLSATNLTVATTLTVASLTAGRVVYVGASDELADSAGLTWDNATDTLSITGDAALLEIAQTSTGDALVTMSADSTDWTFGIDNSVSNRFALAHTTALGTASDLLRLTVDGEWSYVGQAVSTGADAEFTHHDFNVAGGTITLTTGATLATQRTFRVRQPTFAADAATQAITDAATVYIDGPPIASTNVSITNPYSLWIADGHSFFSASHATTTPQLTLNQASTGDSGIRWAIGTTASYIAGIDNSDSDKWKLSYAASGTAVLGTGDLLTVTTTGFLGVGVTPTATLHVVQTATTSGTAKALLITAGSHTNWTTATGIADIDFAINRTVDRDSGAVAADRFVVIRQPTVAFDGASTVTTGATLSIIGAPVAGTNATITNPYGLIVESGRIGALNSASGADSIAFVLFNNLFSGTLPAYGIGMGPTSTEGFMLCRAGTGSTSDHGFKWQINNIQAMRLSGQGLLATYTTGAALSNQISSVAATATVFNETGLDIDFRVESDDEPYCLMVEATLNNVVMCATTEPGFNSMDGGVFLAEANVVPTGNPTAGIYIYVESGAGKARGTGGTITTWAPAEPHCPTCGYDYIHEWENPGYQQSYLAVCMKCLTDEIGERPWIVRAKAVKS